MILGNPFGLLALLALPTIVGIHLFRRRFRPRPVSGLFLYGQQMQVPASGRARSRLRRTLSLLCELLAALAMTWYLSDPHLADRDQARHLVLVLDSRLRLQAQDSDGSTAEQRVRVAAKAVIAALNRDDRVTLIASDLPPRLLVGPGARPAAAHVALDAWHADRSWHELDEALALAIELGGVGAQISTLSDRIPDGLPKTVSSIACGRAAPTSGIADARWLRDGQGERLAVRILAQGGSGERRLALVDARGAVLSQQSVRLTAGTPIAITISVAPGLADGASLGLRLLGDDPFPEDDAVTLLRPTSRHVSVRIDLPEATAKPVRKAIAAISDAVEVTPGQPAHLLIGANSTLPPQGSWLVQLTIGTAQPVLGPFLARSGDPILADLDCTGALWSGGGSIPRDYEALLLAGDTVLIGGSRRGRDRLIVVSCELPRSTVIHHSLWPVLWANVIAARSAALPGPRDPNLNVGASVRFPLPPGMREAVLVDPDAGRAVLRADADGEILIPGLERAGIHQLLLRDGDSEKPWISLNGLALDPRQSDLTAASTDIHEAATTGRSAVERERAPLAHLLPLVLAAALALTAWFSFPREERA